MSTQAKKLVPKAKNTGVIMAELNITLIGNCRVTKQFGLAEDLMKEANQVYIDLVVVFI